MNKIKYSPGIKAAQTQLNTKNGNCLCIAMSFLADLLFGADQKGRHCDPPWRKQSITHELVSFNEIVSVVPAGTFNDLLGQPQPIFYSVIRGAYVAIK